LPLSPNTRQARCGSAKPASCCGPRSSRSNSPPICRRGRCGDHQRVRRGQGLQPSGKVRRPADDPALLRCALADQIADHGQPGGDAEPYTQSFARRQPADRFDHREAGVHRPLGIVLMRLRISEINQHAVAHVFGDKAVKAADRLGDTAMIGADDLAQILGIEPRR